jgi:hypothetical protein
MDECIQALIDEFKFFRIPLDIIKDCCYAEFHLEYENNSNSTKLAKQNRPARPSTTPATNETPTTTSPNYVNRFRDLLLGPSTGEWKAATRAVLLCVIFNIAGMVLETLPCSSKSENCGELYARTFFISDAICVCILTTEFAVTLARAPRKREYFCQVPNMAYFVSLVPAYLTWLLYIVLGFGNIPGPLDDMFKALRVFRVVKIANSSSHLRETVGQIVSAARGLALVLLTCTIAVIVLSVLLYHLDDSCPHVPMGMWYFVVTMTSLG